MNNKSYQIKKVIKNNFNKIQHVLLLNSNVEVFETHCFGEVTKLCQLLNTNSTNGFRYEIITILNK
jgi:hypothetical protein